MDKGYQFITFSKIVKPYIKKYTNKKTYPRVDLL